MKQRINGQKKAYFYPLLEGLLVFIIGIILSCIIFIQAHHNEQKNFLLQFKNEALIKSDLLIQKIEHTFFILEAMGFLFEDNPSFSLQNFQNIIQTLHQEVADFQLIGWCPQVSTTDLPKIEKQGRFLYQNKFRISIKNDNKSLSNNSEPRFYYPIFYLATTNESPDFLGFDLGSDQKIQNLIETARDTAQTVISDIMTPLFFNSTNNGFLLLHPVYSNDEILLTIEKRRSEFKGIILGFIQTENALKSLITSASENYLLYELIDLSLPKDSRLIHKANNAHDKNTFPWLAIFYSTPPQFIKNITSGNRKWELSFKLTNAYITQNYHFSYGLILVYGFLLSLVLGLYIYNLQSRRHGLISQINQCSEDVIESEKRYKEVFNLSLDSIITTDSHGKILMVNPAACRLFGYEKQELLGKLIEETYLPDERFLSLSRLKEVAEGKSLTFERKALRQDGSVIIVDVSFSAVTPNYYQIMMRDVTERKRIEKAEHEREIAEWKKRYEIVVAASKQIVYDYTIETGELKWSGSIKQVLDYDINEMSNGITQWMGMINPGDRDSVLARFMMADKKNTPYEAEYHIMHRKGYYIPVHDIGFFIFNDAGTAIHMIGILRDITEEKKAEEVLIENETKFRTVIEQFVEGFYLMDKEGHILEWNQALETITGIKRAEIQGHSIRDLSHAFSPLEQQLHGYEEIKNITQNALTFKESSYFNYPIELEMQKPDGEKRYLQQIIFPVKTGKEYYIGAITQDITDRKIYRDFLEKLSMTDGLTGIANRRYFDEYLENEWLRATRNQTSLSLILIDVDEFKQYNDNYGHLKGDESLKNIANTVKESLQRPADLPARYGGEEFACILPETNNSGGLSVARRIYSEINRKKIPHEYSSVCKHITLSFGVASIIPALNQKSSILIERADQFLYQAKQKGRNTIMSNQPKTGA